MVVTHMLQTIMYTANYQQVQNGNLLTRFNLRGDWGDDQQIQEYRIGDVVRLGGYTYPGNS